MYYAHVLQKTYLAIGYGSSMQNTDMVAFSAENTTALSLCQDLYSTTEGSPSVDETNSY